MLLLLLFVFVLLHPSKRLRKVQMKEAILLCVDFFLFVVYFLVVVVAPRDYLFDFVFFCALTCAVFPTRARSLMLAYCLNDFSFFDTCASTLRFAII